MKVFTALSRFEGVKPYNRELHDAVSKCPSPNKSNKYARYQKFRVAQATRPGDFDHDDSKFNIYLTYVEGSKLKEAKWGSIRARKLRIMLTILRVKNIIT